MDIYIIDLSEEEKEELRELNDKIDREIGCRNE
jgi:hypothetical protein